MGLKGGQDVKVGYTDDRKVWMIADVKGTDGKPCMAQFLWEPDLAANIAKAIQEAADGAVSKIIRPGG